MTLSIEHRLKRRRKRIIIIKKNVIDSQWFNFIVACFNFIIWDEEIGLSLLKRLANDRCIFFSF